MLLNSIHSLRGETADIQEEEEGTVVTEHPDSKWFPRGLDLGNKTMSFSHTHTHTDILSLMHADKLLCAVGHVARHSLGAGVSSVLGSESVAPASPFSGSGAGASASEELAAVSAVLSPAAAEVSSGELPAAS